MTHLELSKLVDTMNVADSKALELLGKNVRSPSLVPGTLYIMKEWTTVHHVNYDNPFTVVEFIGAGRETNGVREMFTENPQIKTMQQGDYYYFKGIDKAKHEAYEFGAYMFENCVCITSSAVRVTCYAIIGHESQGFDATPKAVKPVKSPKIAKTPTAAAEYDDIALDYGSDDDDGLGCKDAWICHPISLRPLRRLNG